MNNMPQGICFTGHRYISKTILEETLLELRHFLEQAIEKGVLDFYTGGAIGWDTYAAELILELKEQYPEIALHLVLPCSREEQTKHWTTQQLQAYDKIYIQADDCEFIAEDYTKTCMKERNQRLVDLADCCICYCRDYEGRTGTAQTIRMAKQKGIPVINFFNEADKESSEIIE